MKLVILQLNLFTQKLQLSTNSFFLLEQSLSCVSLTDEHETLFQKLKTSLTSETELKIPNTKHRFFITVDASLIGLGAVLSHLNEENKMKVISYNSCIQNLRQQKLSTLGCELLGIVQAFQIYDFLIIGFPHPIHVFTDHKPFSQCFTKIGNLSLCFYRAHLLLTKFSKHKIFHTPGKISVADILGRYFTKTEVQINQLKHKKLLILQYYKIVHLNAYIT